MKTILLKLSGPMQSWGTDSRFETRNTGRYPSKSSIIGMIAASLGYRREETEKIIKLNKLDFAVRVDQGGTILRDYHIAKSYKESGAENRTYVTNRYYLQDSVFVVGIGSNDMELMGEIEKALKKPYFQPFLGRRSLPLNADFFIKVVERGVMESLIEIPWQASRWYKKREAIKDKLVLEVYSDSHLVDDSNGKMVRDLPKSFSQRQRMHGFRSIAKSTITLDLEHDAFGNIGGQYADN